MSILVPGRRHLPSLALVAALGLMLATPAHAQSSGTSPKGSSWSIGEQWSKLTGGNKDKEKPPTPDKLDSSLSVYSEQKPTPKVHLAIAELYEQAGQYPEAEKQYKAALKLKSDDLGTLLRYARLKEQTGANEEALKLYQQAAKAHSNEASVYNNLGLFHARKNRYDEAMIALGRALMLQPKNTLYRNNMATVLVDMNRVQEAFSHLRAVHSEGAAYYNLGYLLQRKGRTADAVQCFEFALRSDASLTAARNWLARLQPDHPLVRDGRGGGDETAAAPAAQGPAIAAPSSASLRPAVSPQAQPSSAGPRLAAPSDPVTPREGDLGPLSNPPREPALSPMDAAALGPGGYRSTVGRDAFSPAVPSYGRMPVAPPEPEQRGPAYVAGRQTRVVTTAQGAYAPRSPADAPGDLYRGARSSFGETGLPPARPLPPVETAPLPPTPAPAPLPPASTSTQGMYLLPPVR